MDAGSTAANFDLLFLLFSGEERPDVPRRNAIGPAASKGVIGGVGGRLKRLLAAALNRWRGVRTDLVEVARGFLAATVGNFVETGIFDWN